MTVNAMKLMRLSLSQGSCGAEDKPPASVTIDSALEHRQCILAAPHGLFRIPSASHIVWIDALQLHGLPQPAGTARPREIGAPRHIDVGGSAAMVFATRLVLKGAATGSYAAALWDSSSAMHFEGKHFLYVFLTSDMGHANVLFRCNCSMVSFSA